MTREEIALIVEKQRRYFQTGATLPVEHRIHALKKLQQLILTHESERPQGASHGGSEKSGKLEVGGASRHSTGFGALEEGLISS